MTAATKLPTPRTRSRVKPAVARAAGSAIKLSWKQVRFSQLTDLDAMGRIDVIKTGLPATVPGLMADRMGVSKEQVYAILGLPRATVERKVREGKVLPPDESARVLGIGRLIGLVERMVAESGRPEGFDAAGWVADWLRKPIPALGGRKPAELMDTMDGQSLVSDVLSPRAIGGLLVSLVVWRIGSDAPDWEAHDRSGKGAEATGGRWNSKGRSVVYAAGNLALAVLETAVHIEADSLPLNRFVVTIEIPDDLWARRLVHTEASLPVGWMATPAGRVSLAIGDAWLASGSSAVMQVPSVIVREEFNVLINARHPDARHVRARKEREWFFDSRIKR